MPAARMESLHHLLCCAVSCRLWPSRETFSTKSNSSVRIMYHRISKQISLILLSCPVLVLKHNHSKSKHAHCWFLFLSIRSGAAEVNAEATGRVPITVSEGNRAAGWGYRPGFAVFRGKPRGEIYSLTGLQQTSTGAKNTPFTPTRYSVLESLSKHFKWEGKLFQKYILLSIITYVVPVVT